MIKGFRDKDTEKVYSRQWVRRWHPDLQQAALDRLISLNHARELSHLALTPGHRLETLKGDRQGQHSIRINRQWRICFRWEDGDAYQVEITDYH